MPNALDTLTARMQAALDANMDGYFSGLLDAEAWWLAMDVDLETYHTAAYLAGRGVASVDALTPAQVQELAALITQQSAYLDGFAAALPDLSEAQARARATLYSGALRETINRAEYYDWQIPVVPTVGSECTVNCKCELRIDVLDREELDANVLWIRHASESCATCVRRADGSPYRIRQGEWEKELY